MKFWRFKYGMLFVAGLLMLSHCKANRYHEEIGRAVAYLNGRGEKLQPVAVPILSNLQRQYKIPVNIAAAERIAQGGKNERRHVFQRHMHNGSVASRDDIMKLRGIDHTTAVALYCDLYALPLNFFSEVRSLANQGGYALTHATLAMAMVRAKNCTYDRKVYQAELRRQINQLRFLLQNTRVDSDLGIEAILMLHLSRRSPDMAGEPSHVNPLWIEQILAAQSPDGSWYQNDHTTVIALWLLLELQNS